MRANGGFIQISKVPVLCERRKDLLWSPHSADGEPHRHWLKAVSAQTLHCSRVWWEVFCSFCSRKGWISYEVIRGPRPKTEERPRHQAVWLETRLGRSFRSVQTTSKGCRAALGDLWTLRGFRQFLRKPNVQQKNALSRF